MDTLKQLSNHATALMVEADKYKAEAKRIYRLLPEIGKNAAIVGDAYEQRMSLIEVGDTVYSKYGQSGVVVSFDNIDADLWYDVSVTFTDAENEGQEITHTADRLNYSKSIMLD